MKIADCLEELVAVLRGQEKTTGSAETVTETTPIALEDVRAVLADLSRQGHTKEMKALLSKFGAARLSDVDPRNYAALLSAAKEVSQNA